VYSTLTGNIAFHTVMAVVIVAGPDRGGGSF
jgi:hypothetical protein